MPLNTDAKSTLRRRISTLYTAAFKCTLADSELRFEGKCGLKGIRLLYFSLTSGINSSATQRIADAVPIRPGRAAFVIIVSVYLLSDTFSVCGMALYLFCYLFLSPYHLWKS